MRILSAYNDRLGWATIRTKENLWIVAVRNFCLIPAVPLTVVAGEKQNIQLNLLSVHYKKSQFALGHVRDLKQESAVCYKTFLMHNAQM